MVQEVRITLPAWINVDVLKRKSYPDPSDQVGLAITLAEKNVIHKTGGPFGAAVFDRSGQLISVGTNRVEPENNSVSHAEIFAIMLAQSELNLYRLDLDPAHLYSLASSAQPCSMCFGALLWSGIAFLYYGAAREDVIRLTGFDEGPMPEDWIQECRNRNIHVEGGFLKDRADDCLRNYAQNKGTIY